MGSRASEVDGQPTADSTPEDVAALYSWANLHGAKYRDYSASRREYRAQVRYRAAKALLDRELAAQQEAEASATEAERLAQDAEIAAQAQGDTATRVQSRRIAEAAARKAAAERVEAARRAEAAAHAAVLALREEREIVDAHSSARRKEVVYEESELRRRELAGPQPHLSRIQLAPLAPAESTASATGTLQQFFESRLPELTDSHPNIPHPGFPFTQEPARFTPASSEAAIAPAIAPYTAQELQQISTASENSELDPVGPAWLYASQTPPRTRVSQSVPHSHKDELAAGDTLQDSRERVAARWVALKDVFEGVGPALPAMQPIRSETSPTRLLTVFSLAGGAGKTSLVATLGRALSAQGEKVLLLDTTSQALLPVYFGVRQIRPGELCTFPVPAESISPPISIAVADIAGKGSDERQQELATELLLRNGQGNQRLLLDIASESSWLLRRVADLHPVVLVPLAPDMNSVLSLQAVEKLFRNITDSNGLPLRPFYVLNQFDTTVALHLDVREVLRRQLGDRLLRTAIRRSQAVSEALAQGMTVVDYAPATPVAQDYLDVATWLRSVSPPATAESPSPPRGQQ
jgi:cellulose biosynthesis protein BcsQ